MGKFTIELKDLWFFSFHGLHAEERDTGGEFRADLSAKIISAEETPSHLRDTVNYVTLYEIIKSEMHKPQALLETVASNISEKIRHELPLVSEIEIFIEKKNPPIVGFSGTVGVRYKKVF